MARRTPANGSEVHVGATGGDVPVGVNDRGADDQIVEPVPIEVSRARNRLRDRGQGEWSHREEGVGEGIVGGSPEEQRPPPVSGGTRRCLDSTLRHEEIPEPVAVHVPRARHDSGEAPAGARRLRRPERRTECATERRRAEAEVDAPQIQGIGHLADGEICESVPIQVPDGERRAEVLAGPALRFGVVEDEILLRVRRAASQVDVAGGIGVVLGIGERITDRDVRVAIAVQVAARDGGPVPVGG